MVSKQGWLLSLALLISLPVQADDALLKQGMQLLDATMAPRATAPTSARSTPSLPGLGSDQIGAGLKEALRLGSERTISMLGKKDGFLQDSAVHIPLPGVLGQAQSALKMAGAAGLTEDLEVRMNRAAEAAVPKGASIFADAIGKMSITDAQAILSGPKDAATQYFRRTTSDPLGAAMRPIIDQSLENVGAVQALNAVTSKYRTLPLVGALNLDLTSFVLEKTLDGLFLYIAKEESAIRENPARRTTDLLRQVFGK